MTERDDDRRSRHRLLHRRRPARGSRAGTSTPAARPGSCRARWRIPIVPYGRQKVCLWTYFDTPPLHDGTAFFVDNRDAYLSWVWDIPISPRQTSVGFVLPAESAARPPPCTAARSSTILREELARHPRFRGLLEDAAHSRGREHGLSGLRDGQGLRSQLADDRRSRIDAGPADRQWPDLRYAPRAPRRRRDPRGRGGR